MNHRKTLHSFDSLPQSTDVTLFAKACIAKEGVKAPTTRLEVRTCIRCNSYDEAAFEAAFQSIRDARAKEREAAEKQAEAERKAAETKAEADAKKAEKAEAERLKALRETEEQAS